MYARAALSVPTLTLTLFSAECIKKTLWNHLSGSKGYSACTQMYVHYRTYKTSTK